MEMPTVAATTTTTKCKKECKKSQVINRQNVRNLDNIHTYASYPHKTLLFQWNILQCESNWRGNGICDVNSETMLMLCFLSFYSFVLFRSYFFSCSVFFFLLRLVFEYKSRDTLTLLLSRTLWKFTCFHL